MISAPAPPRIASAGLVDWMDAHPAELFLSAMTVMAIENGVATLRRGGATRRSADPASWRDAALHLSLKRILLLHAGTARIAGALPDDACGQGQLHGVADLISAATAQRHGLIVLSRNLKNFAPLGTRARPNGVMR